VPGLPFVLLGFMPTATAVPAFDRAWIALVLTFQVIGGVILGLAAEALVAVLAIGHLMPWVGLELLGIARDVAACNLPMRLWLLFGAVLYWSRNVLP
jgi:hypothetical protein